MLNISVQDYDSILCIMIIDQDLNDLHRIYINSMKEMINRKHTKFNVKT